MVMKRRIQLTLAVVVISILSVLLAQNVGVDGWTGSLLIILLETIGVIFIFEYFYREFKILGWLQDYLHKLAQGNILLKVKSNVAKQPLGQAVQAISAYIKNIFGGVMKDAIQIAETCQQIKTAVEEISRASERISLITQEIAQQNFTQTEYLYKTAGYIKKMGESIGQAQELADETVKVSVSSMEVAKNGSVAVEKLLRKCSESKSMPNKQEKKSTNF